ncbi:MAG: FkbM family methyltransferase [Aridibacter sp.]
MKLNKLKHIKDFPGKLNRFVKRGFKRGPEAFLRRVSGVIHVGANDGEERFMYANYNLDVVWIEPIPEVFARLKNNLDDFPGQRAYQYLVTDQDGREYDFHIANNNGQSSSILDFKQHKDIWADIHYEKSISLKSTKLSSLIEVENIEMNKYDALVMDTQGTELLVLKGAENLLSRFQYIKTEAADFEIYKNCCQVKDLEDFLGNHGFKELIRTKFASREDGGNCYDIVYKKSNWQRIKNSRS